MGNYLNRFDEWIERKNTGSLKYDFGPKRKGRDDLLPMWVADMDFEVPDEVKDAIIRRTAHGIFGYTEPDDEYLQALREWYLQEHGWLIRDEWNTVTPGVVYGISVAIRAFTNPGDAVLIQPPVYYPFRETVEENGRVLIRNELVLENGRYEVDLDDFEQKIRDHQVKLFLLCNPHNPVGRVWTKEELLRMGEVCRRYGVIVFADEIHGDFVYGENRYTPFASMNEELAKITVTGTSASKTFNLAGLQVSNIIISDRKLRQSFRRENEASGYSQSNTLGLVATEAAYRYGKEWLQDLRTYLGRNLAYIRRFLSEQVPGIRLIEPEGTYLIWLDCRDVVKTAAEMKDLFENRARVWGDPGRIFGESGELFERLNIATPRSVIELAMNRLKQAL